VEGRVTAPAHVRRTHPDLERAGVVTGAAAGGAAGEREARRSAGGCGLALPSVDAPLGRPSPSSGVLRTTHQSDRRGPTAPRSAPSLGRIPTSVCTRTETPSPGPRARYSRLPALDQTCKSVHRPESCGSTREALWTRPVVTIDAAHEKCGRGPRMVLLCDQVRPVSPAIPVARGSWGESGGAGRWAPGFIGSTRAACRWPTNARVIECEAVSKFAFQVL